MTFNNSVYDKIAMNDGFCRLIWPSHPSYKNTLHDSTMLQKMTELYTMKKQTNNQSYFFISLSLSP